MGVFDDFLKPQPAPWVSPFQGPLGPFGLGFTPSALGTPFGPSTMAAPTLAPTPYAPTDAQQQLFAGQIATFNAPPRPQQGNDPTPQQIYDAIINGQGLGTLPIAGTGSLGITPPAGPIGPVGTPGGPDDLFVGVPGIAGPAGGKGKKKKKQTGILPPWLQALIQNPPTPAPYVPLKNPSPSYKPLTDDKIEAMRLEAYNRQDHDIHEALVEYALVRKRVANSPDMTVKSKRQANAWIDARIRTIERQQKAERASGIATATQLRASGQAAAEMQMGLGEAVGRNYTEAAKVLNTLGQGVGAGVQAMGDQSLQNIGIAGQPTSPLAGGLMPGAIPATSGQAVATVGGALPAQNLALQAAGAGPGYVSGGVTNILGQTAAQILAGGNQMALGAQIAGAQRARDLNAKIQEAQEQFPQLYSQLLGTNQAHQDAINKQLLDMAQGGLETVFKASQIPIDRIDKLAGQKFEEAKFANSYSLDVWQGINALNSADRAHQDAVNALQYQKYSDTIARGFDYVRIVQSIKAANQKAAAAGKSGAKLPTVAQARVRYNKFTDAMAGLAGRFQFTNGAGIPAVYGEPEIINGESFRKMINTPVTIDEAIKQLSLKFPDQTGYSGPGATKAEKLQRHAFLEAIKDQYGLKGLGWTDAMAEAGIGPIPGTDFIGKLPLLPIYTLHGEVKNGWKEEGDKHDPMNFGNPFYDKWFEEHGGKIYKGGGGGITGPYPTIPPNSPGWVKKWFDKEFGPESENYKRYHGGEYSGATGGASSGTAHNASYSNSSNPWAKTAATIATQYGVPPNIFVAQMTQESGLNPNTRASSAGAQGIAQIVPASHPGAPPASDPMGQLRYAAKWMSELHQKYGNWEQALSVYNSGQPDTYKDPSFARGETYNYVRSIMGNAGQMGGAQTVAYRPNTGKVAIAGPTTNIDSDFLQRISAAAAAVGATQIIIESGYRDPDYNRKIGGAKDSNHTYGHAIDGYAVINGQRIPLGVALAGIVGQYGLRSGANDPTFFRGKPDPNHVDDNFNKGGYV